MTVPEATSKLPTRPVPGLDPIAASNERIGDLSYQFGDPENVTAKNLKTVLTKIAGELDAFEGLNRQQMTGWEIGNYRGCWSNNLREKLNDLDRKGLLKELTPQQREDIDRAINKLAQPAALAVAARASTAQGGNIKAGNAFESSTADSSATPSPATMQRIAATTAQPVQVDSKSITAQIRAQRDGLKIDPSLKGDELRKEVDHRIKGPKHHHVKITQQELKGLVSLRKLLDKERSLLADSKRLDREMTELTHKAGKKVRQRHRLGYIARVGRDFIQWANKQIALYGGDSSSQRVRTKSDNILRGLYTVLSPADRHVPDKFVGRWNTAMDNLEFRLAKYDSTKPTPVRPARPSHRVVASASPKDRKPSSNNSSGLIDI